MKKIKKFLKISIVTMMMFSLVLPSYAYLSATDGSSFVTKAEFDSALADFNARLTTFEAGINSKIDSQVTSYLDRNGIWKGKEQVLVDANKEWQYGFKADGTYTAKYGINPQVGNIWKCTSYTVGKVAIFDNKSGQLVAKINKSGLAVVSTECPDSDVVNSDPRCYVVNSNATVTAFASDHFQFVWTAQIDFKQDGKVLNRVDGVFEGIFAGAYLVAPALPANVLVMFVSAEKPLEISYSNTLLRDSGTNWANTLGWVGGTAGGSYRKWRVTDITVY